MATQARWVELFREIIGRDPEPEEFFAGKASGFDLKQIKPIAGVAFNSEAVENELASEGEAADLNASGSLAKSKEEKDASSVADLFVSSVDLENSDAETVWVEQFMTLLGRFPTDAEMTQGAQAGYSLASLTPFLQANQSETQVVPVNPQVQGGPVVPTPEIGQTRAVGPNFTPKKKMGKWKKRGLVVLILLVLAGIAGYAYGSFYYSREEVAKRYIEAVENDFDDSLSYEVWSDTKKTITTKDLTYVDQDSATQTTDKRSLLSGDKMQVVGRVFYIFPKWAVVVNPIKLTVISNTKNLTIQANSKDVLKTTGTSDQKELSHLYPGTYNFTATGDVNGQAINISQEVTATIDQTVKLNVQYVSFSVSSNIKDGDLYVGTQKVATLSDGQAQVTNLAVVGESKVYVKKTFSDKSTLESDSQVTVSSISNGEKVTLDTSTKILDRDTADDLVTQAYNKLGSYASNQETPDGLTDIFKNGNENKFYTDVKDTIDTNTTGAKNRAADSINFYDVDVTKVTQTGKETYTVDFTVMYSFYYGYSSQHKTSGYIRQKLSWSCTVSLKEDRDQKKSSSSYYSNYYEYENYYITGTNGQSSVINTEDTVD